MEKSNSVFNYIKSLEDGWGGKETKKFDIDFVNAVERIVSGLNIEPKVFPLFQGGIQIEYEENNKYLEFEFSVEKLKEQKVTAFCKWNNRETTFDVIGEDLTESINILLDGYKNL